MKGGNGLTVNSLAAAAQQGDNAACAALWGAVRRYGLSVALRYKAAAEANGAADVEDLEQLAALAMMETLKTWQPDGGTSFIGWYGYHVQRACRVALGINGRNRAEHYQKISLYTPIGSDDDDLTLADTLADESLPGMTDAIELTELQEDVHAAIDRLPPAQAEIVRLHDLQGVPLHKIGTTYTRQAHKIAMDHLRKDYHLRAYVPYFTRHKGLTAFKSSFSSVVEDAVIERIDRLKL